MLMFQKTAVCFSEGFDPYANLALEKYLLDSVEEDQCILYLWQNQNTVVIGKNQNAWAECRVANLEADGGKLARRLSGGGAVFHDLGNLNFTFLVPENLYDLDKQLAVIQQACLLAGIPTEKSGRNDILAEGRKFSGNAFYHAGGKAYHHGTILIDVDTQKLQKYLSPPKAKLESKGVTSVRSRVVNLKELLPSLTCQQMKEYMCQAFAQVYGLTPAVLCPPAPERLSSVRQEYASWEYLFGKPLPFTTECQAHYPWGHIHLQLAIQSGIITGANVYSDAMDWAMPEAIRNALSGCRFAPADILDALKAVIADTQILQDLCSLLLQQTL